MQFLDFLSQYVNLSSLFCSLAILMISLFNSFFPYLSRYYQFINPNDEQSMEYTLEKIRSSSKLGLIFALIFFILALLHISPDDIIETFINTFYGAKYQ